MNPTLTGSKNPAINSRLSTKLSVLNLVLACAFAINLGCGGTNPESLKKNADDHSRHAIVDGEDVTSMTDARSTTVQVYDQDAFHTATCTGTLIADDIAQTAAHCVSETNPTEIKLSIGFTSDFDSSFGPYAKSPAARGIAGIILNLTRPNCTRKRSTCAFKSFSGFRRSPKSVQI